MKKILALYVFGLWFYAPGFSQNYTFDGSITKEIISEYLNRSLNVSAMSHIDPNDNLSLQKRMDLVDMIDNTGAKFVHRMAGIWSQDIGANSQDYFDRVAENVAMIKAVDGDIICDAAIFEFIPSKVENFVIDEEIWLEMGFNLSDIPPDYRIPRSLMMYNSDDNPCGDAGLGDYWNANAINIHSRVSQVWYYYLARNYLDAGCESLHFGQTNKTNRHDKGNKKFKFLFDKIRDYASTRNRGIVLLNGNPMYHEPNFDGSCSDWKNHVQTHKSEGQLLLDFHVTKTFIKEGEECQPDQQIIFDIDNHEFVANRGNLGGIHPSDGSHCSENFYMFNLDNWDSMAQNGCNFVEDSSNDWYVWGFDEISWFANQSENYRNDILAYMYYKVKCYSSNYFFSMPGRRRAYLLNQNGVLTYGFYHAMATDFKQEAVIKDIWNGTYDEADSWVRKDFSILVSQGYDVSNAKSDLVAVGNDKIYYISLDGRIHGFVLDDGVWYSVSPSWSSVQNGTLIVDQMIASSDLKADQSEQNLFYRGIDGLLYKIEIHDKWNYSYHDMETNSELISSNKRIRKNTLLLVSDYQIYYISDSDASVKDGRIHGIVKFSGIWYNVSPTWSSGPVHNQVKAHSDLIANPSGNVLYYIGGDGMLYQFDVHSIWSYSYSSFEGNSYLQETGKTVIPTTLLCAVDDRIYYSAEVLQTFSIHNRRVHAFVRLGGGWSTVSPSWAAGNIGNQALVDGNFLVTRDKKKITYLGLDQELHGFEILNQWEYSYFDFNKSPSAKKPNSSMFMSGESLLYYIGQDNKLHFYGQDADFCGNSSIKKIEPNCCVFLSSQVSGGDVKVESPHIQFDGKDIRGELRLIPNPTSDGITICHFPENVQGASGVFRVFDDLGNMVFDRVFDEIPADFITRVNSRGLFVITLETEMGVISQLLIRI